MAINPDVNSIFVQLQLDLQASAIATLANYNIPSNNVKIGHVEFLQKQEFWEYIAETGYFIVIGLPRGEGNFFNWEGKFQIVVELFYPIPADTGYDWVAQTNMLATLIAGWSHILPINTQWTKGQNRSPLHIEYALPSLRTHEKPYGKFLECESFIVSQKITFTMPVIMDQIAHPCEEPLA
jgi:hypothetical protein